MRHAGYLPLAWAAILAHYLRPLLCEAGGLLPMGLSSLGFETCGGQHWAAHPAVISFLQAWRLPLLPAACALPASWLCAAGCRHLCARAKEAWRALHGLPWIKRRACLTLNSTWCYFHGPMQGVVLMLGGGLSLALTCKIGESYPPKDQPAQMVLTGLLTMELWALIVGH